MAPLIHYVAHEENFFYRYERTFSCCINHFTNPTGGCILVYILVWLEFFFRSRPSFETDRAFVRHTGVLALPIPALEWFMSFFLQHPSAARNVFRTTKNIARIRKDIVGRSDNLKIPIVAPRDPRNSQSPLPCVTPPFRGQHHSRPRQLFYSTTTALRVRSCDKMEGPVDQRTAPLAKLITDDLERPALDDRSYRVIKLPNQLEALLIHDPETDKASGALDVNVGSFSDADDMPGLAHAVEHMLFMGTKKVGEANFVTDESTLPPTQDRGLTSSISFRKKTPTTNTSPHTPGTQMPTQHQRLRTTTLR